MEMIVPPGSNEKYYQRNMKHKDLMNKEDHNLYTLKESNDHTNSLSKTGIVNINDYAIPESSQYNTHDSMKDKQVFSFSKTPKFGSVAPTGLNKNAFQKICD